MHWTTTSSQAQKRSYCWCRRWDIGKTQQPGLADKVKCSHAGSAVIDVTRRHTYCTVASATVSWLGLVTSLSCISRVCVPYGVHIPLG
jgi:hypothetical protein